MLGLGIWALRVFGLRVQFAEGLRFRAVGFRAWVDLVRQDEEEASGLEVSLQMSFRVGHPQIL